MNTTNEIKKSSSCLLILKKYKSSLIKVWKVLLKGTFIGIKELKLFVQKYKKIILIGLAFLIVIIATIIIFSNKSANDTTQKAQIKQVVSVQPVIANQSSQAGDYLTQRLQDISEQLMTIHHQLDQSSSQKVNQQISSLIDQIKVLSSESNKLITQQIQQSTHLLQKQLYLINARLIKLQVSQKHIKYLKPKALPFRVLSVDNIQQNNVVTIVYNKTTFPIEVGSYIAGWKLITSDFISQKTEFINAKSQHVIVDLNRLNSK